MATSSTREGASSMSEEKNEQLLAGREPGLVGKTRQFWHDVKMEMKKVSWPARNEVVNTTIIVVLAVIFFGFYLFGIDMVFAYLIQWIEWGAAWIFG
jgi:preprotein translocase subunit SecE